MQLCDFLAKYPPKAPRKPPDCDDQCRLLVMLDGVVTLVRAPFPTPVSGDPGFPEGKHLWVFTPASIPTILETAPNVRPPPLQSGVAKHTNLTGGEAASCGGELWVDAVSSSLLWVNGGSGRYGPKTPEQLAHAVEVLQGLGFKVESAGWDEDHDLPARTFRSP